MSVSVSACVISFEEEARLPACLAGLDFCDEVIVVDSGSRDRTREIARAAGATVIENPWPGYAAQRNLALGAANGDWILEVDADERVSPELAAEIRAFVERVGPEVRIAAIPLRQIFLGRALGPAARYPGYRHRLFRRGAYRHDERRKVHEGLWPDGPTPPLDHDLRHLLAGSWGEALRDTVAYARLESGQRAGVGARDAVAGIVVRPLVKFAYRALVYGGWRDGRQGLLRIALECAGDALATAYRIGRPRAQGTGGFGQEAPHLGPVRIVGVAAGARGAARLEPWLADAALAGAEVALIAPPTTGTTAIRRRILSGPGPGATLRALDAEEQLRPIDALVFADRRAALAARLAPAALRGAVPPVDRGAPAAAVVGRLQEGARGKDSA